MAKKKHPYITVMGPVGVGKTTVARILGKEFGFRIFEERFENNPFLADSYKDMKRWSFHSQVFFLIQKARQMKKITPLLVKKGVIHEPPIFQDALVFAKARLKGREWDLYEMIYRNLIEDLPVPDLLIYLQVSLGKLLPRIASRGRNYELRTPKSYWQQLIDNCEAFIKKTRLPVLTIDTGKINYVKRKADKEYLISEVGKWLGKRKR
jgi:deoxyguanosine kinase